MTFPDGPEWRLGVALAIGLIMGAEREKRKGDGPSRGAAGVRTFAVTALLGGVAAQLGGAAVVVFGALVGVAAVAAYVLGDRADPGLTTEVALILDYALGVLAHDAPELAFAVTVAATAILAFRTRLHEVVRDVLTESELLDLLIFAVAAVIVWPLLPDRAVDPLGVLNPFLIWRLVVLVMGMTGLGHVAQRLIGPRFGLAMAGFASGFVSSIATIHTMGQAARADPAVRPAATAGAAASSAPTFLLMALLVGSASTRLLVRLAVPLAAGAAVALGFALVMVVRAARTTAKSDERVRAFRLRTAVAFALIVAVITFAAEGLRRLLGSAGALGAAALGAFADSHAAGASVAALDASGAVTTGVAAAGVLTALTTNAVTKVVVAFTSGPRSFALQIALGQLITLGAAWGVLALGVG